MRDIRGIQFHAGDKLMATSKRVASRAGELLENKRTPKKVRPVVASDLAQARPTKKKAPPGKAPKR
jgi:hypothetical protein